jgi:hypothetical protein
MFLSTLGWERTQIFLFFLVSISVSNSYILFVYNILDFVCLLT